MAATTASFTADKIGVAQQYVSSYYKRLLGNPNQFAREHMRPRSKRMSIDDLELLALIGRGAFGEVRLCIKRDDPTRTVYALKKLKKEVMVKRKQVQHVRAERNLMVEARKSGAASSQWLVELKHTFQDAEHLFFVMEYCPGGDMMTWLIKYEIFPEASARFYIAELILAVHSLHLMNYAHRDLKPDNILLDHTGHIKLSDFGLCKQAPDDASAPGDSSLTTSLGGTASGAPSSSAAGATGHAHHHLHDAAARRAQWHKTRGREVFFSTVGSPGYIAPEVLEKRGYSLECDWWSVGVILYEMLCGYPPFCGDDHNQTGQKIMRWRDFLEFPAGADAIGAAATDLISGLLCDASHRLSFESIVQHPFFAGLDWSTLRQQQAPFRIVLSHPLDTRHFDALTQEAAIHGGAMGGGGAAGSSGGATAADSRFLFYGFTSKFDVGGTTMATAQSGSGSGSGGGGGVKQTGIGSSSQSAGGAPGGAPAAAAFPTAGISSRPALPTFAEEE